MMKLLTETQAMSAMAEQCDMQVLDEAALAEVAGGKIPEHFHGCPEVENNPPH